MKNTHRKVMNHAYLKRGHKLIRTCQHCDGTVLKSGPSLASWVGAVVNINLLKPWVIIHK